MSPRVFDVRPLPAVKPPLDQPLGQPDLVGGHGSVLIGSLLDRPLADGRPRLLTDPEAAKHRLIRAFQNAGFLPHGKFATCKARALLLIRDSDRTTAA
jgi:hypothetical protein